MEAAAALDLEVATGGAAVERPLVRRAGVCVGMRVASPQGVMRVVFGHTNARVMERSARRVTGDGGADGACGQYMRS